MKYPLCSDIYLWQTACDGPRAGISARNGLNWVSDGATTSANVGHGCSQSEIRFITVYHGAQKNHLRSLVGIFKRGEYDDENVSTNI
jgi:hypothetical protein